MSQREQLLIEFEIKIVLHASFVRQLAKTVKGPPKIHSVRKPSLVGIIKVRNRHCFCILCKNNLECVTNEAGEKRSFQ